MKKKLIVLLLVLIFSPIVTHGKDFDVSITPEIGYARGTWGSGYFPSPTGKMDESAVVLSGTTQIKYNRWRFQPTIEFQWDSMRFDFATAQAPEQNARQNIYSGRVGLTYDFGLLATYLTAGFSRSHTNARLVEIIRGKAVPHGDGDTSIDDRGYSIHLGVYKAWKIWELNVGPELSIEYFPKKLGFSRCRIFGSGHFIPHFGLRMQF